MSNVLSNSQLDALGEAVKSLDGLSDTLSGVFEATKHYPTDADRTALQRGVIIAILAHLKANEQSVACDAMTRLFTPFMFPDGDGMSYVLLPIPAQGPLQ